MTKTVSHDYGAWDIPPSAVRKLDAQESWWHNSVWVWRLENKGSKGMSLSLNPKDRSRSPGVWGQEKTDSSTEEAQRRTHPFCLLLYGGFDGLNEAPPMNQARGTSFTQSTHSKLTSRNTLMDTLSCQASSAICIPYPVKLTHKMSSYTGGVSTTYALPEDTWLG